MAVFQERNTRGAFKRRNGSRRKAPARVLAAWSNIETATKADAAQVPLAAFAAASYSGVPLAGIVQK